MNTNADPSSPSEVKLGQVRRFSLCGHEAIGLVFREWMHEDHEEGPGIWLVCPVKDMDEPEGEDPSGVSVYAQGDPETFFNSMFGLRGWDGGWAMPCLGGTVDGALISKAPVVGTVIDETVEQCWALFRSQFTGEMPDPEKDFWYFSNEHSKDDWEKSFIVLYDPSDWEDEDEDEDDEDDDGDDSKPASELDDSLPWSPYDTTDSWGPSCSICPFTDNPHKPCAACEKAKAG